MARKTTEEETELWQVATRDVAPLEKLEPLTPENPRAPGITQRKQRPPRTASVSGEEPPFLSLPSLPARTPTPHEPGLDHRTEQRLTRGKMPIEATLDLHGYTQSEAHEALLRFVKSCHATGKRCILIVTGKGRDRQGQNSGVLRTRVPDWLAMPPLSDIILRTRAARQHHGGSGAIYVLLRRIRD